MTDLVGSTELRVRVGEEAADEFRRVHDHLLADTVDQCGGFVIKGLGDGILASFPSAADALSAAVAIQQAVDTYSRRLSESHEVRIGVSGGDVTVEDDDIFGIPVVEAARLCSAASGRQILVADLVKAMARGRGNHWFVSVGSFDLKGLDEPLDAHELRWEPLESISPLPLPGRLSGDHLFGFVGRHRQRAVLETSWDECRNSRRRVVLLAGEAGIGKTRLANEISRSAHNEGAVVLYGGCEEDLAAPYRPWIEALNHLIEHAPVELLEGINRRRLADVARVLPQVHERVTDLPAVPMSDPETERYLFYSGVVALIASLAKQAPVVIVLDDLHWADKPSLVLLQHVVRNSEQERLLVIGTYRDTDLGGESQFGEALALLCRLTGVENVDLVGLDDDEIVGLLEMAVGRDIDDDDVATARALNGETSGNPFFASELLRHLAEIGAVGREPDTAWTARFEAGEVSLPTSVRALIAQRLARLGPSAQPVLSHASVVGREFDFAVLSAGVGLDDEELLGVLERAEAAGLVESLSAARFRFAHALVQHNLYAELSPTRRARTHLMVAESLERLEVAGIRAAEAARHWAASDTEHGLSRAIHYSCEAGAKASAALAPQEAARHYTNAIEFLPRSDGVDEQQCELLLLLARAQCDAGDPEFRRTVVEAAAIAERRGDTGRLVRAALTDYQRGYMSIDDPDRVRILESALAVAGNADTPARAKLLSCLSLELSFSDVERSGALSDEARGIARRLGDASTLVNVWIHGGGGQFPTPEGIAERRAGAIEAMAMVEELGDPVLVFGAAFGGLQSATWLGELDEIDRNLAHLVTLAKEVERPDFRWIATYCQADRALLAGDDVRSERLVEEAYAIGRETEQPGAFTLFAAGMDGVRWHQGRRAEMRDLLAEAAAKDPNLSILSVATPGESGIFVTPDAASANDDLTRMIRELPRDQTWLISLTVLAEMAARRGRRAACAAAYEELLPSDGLFAGSTGVLRGAAAHYLGLLAAVAGSYEAAEHHFRDAAAMHERMQAPFHAARTELEWGQMLLEDPAPASNEGAQQHLERARQIAALHHCSQVERRADRLLEVVLSAG